MLLLNLIATLIMLGGILFVVLTLFAGVANEMKQNKGFAIFVLVMCALLTIVFSL